MSVTRPGTLLALESTPVHGWPPLAWLAVCRKGTPVVRFFHGHQVEVRPTWAGEVAWAGDFDDGGFDQTDIVAGTGVRVREDRAVFVSSGSTLDRLHSLRRGRVALVSNSLPCLLAASDASLDPAYPHYYWDFRSIVRGLGRYERYLSCSAGAVELTYFDNISWSGDALTTAPKPRPHRDFSTFERYRGFLHSSLDRVAANATSLHRRAPLSLLGTLSTGYDSPTVMTLAAEAGCEEVLCFDRAREGPPDAGRSIARALGLRETVVPRAAWREQHMPEAPFIAADAYGSEVHFKGAEPLLARRVLLTGFQGDTTWGKDSHDPAGELLRKDPTGVSLSEFRLRAGFIHCPVPFWGARQVPDLVALSNSPEMAPWDVPGDYSRPICRRIVEEAGVPRNSFGIEKVATSVILHLAPEFLTPASMEDYLAWIRRHRLAWARRRRPPPIASAALDHRLRDLSKRYQYALHGDRKLVRMLGPDRAERARTALDRLGLGPTYLRRYVMPWAIEHAKGAYPAGAP
jgi:hypothetical protein